MDQNPPSRRIEYAGSVHDEREIQAVVDVLRGGPTALRIGKNVRAMEVRVAELFAKRRGVMFDPINPSSSPNFNKIGPHRRIRKGRPTKGGWVLPANGVVTKMSADQVKQLLGQKGG